VNVLVLHGPTLAFLGQRKGDPAGLTLAEVDRRLAERAGALGHTLRTVQTNHEGALVDALWEQRAWAHAVVLNPGPLALGSHVLREAIAACRMPVVEVLLAPPKGRAALERRSLLRDVCAARVGGTGAEAYLKALDQLTSGRSATKSLGRAPASSKTLGPSGPGRGGATKTREDPAGSKTLGRREQEPAASARAAGGSLTRREVRSRIADRLAGRLSPAGLATWARSEWVGLQRGAPVEVGHREQLEEVLQALFLSV